MRVFQYFLRDPVRSSLVAGTASNECLKKDGKLLTYPQVFNYHLKKYSRDDIIT